MARRGGLGVVVSGGTEPWPLALGSEEERGRHREEIGGEEGSPRHLTLVERGVLPGGDRAPPVLGAPRGGAAARHAGAGRHRPGGVLSEATTGAGLAVAPAATRAAAAGPALEETGAVAARPPLPAPVVAAAAAVGGVAAALALPPAGRQARAAEGARGVALRKGQLLALPVARPRRTNLLLTPKLSTTSNTYNTTRTTRQGKARQGRAGKEGLKAEEPIIRLQADHFDVGFGKAFPVLVFCILLHAETWQSLSTATNDMAG